MDSTKVVLGVLAGVAVGATLGILFAPEKGSDTRRKLAGTGGEYADKLEDKFNEFMDTVTAKIDEIKHKSTDLADTAKDKAEDGLNEASVALEQAPHSL